MTGFGDVIGLDHNVTLALLEMYDVEDKVHVFEAMCQCFEWEKEATEVKNFDVAVGEAELYSEEVDDSEEEIG